MRYMEIFRNAPHPISVMTPDGKCVDTNLANERLFRRSRKEIIGTDVEELYAKEDAEKIRNALEEVKKTGSSSCEATCIRGDGATFLSILELSLVKNEEGNITDITISTTDITKLTKRETEAEKARDYATNLMRLAPIPITLVGMDDVRIDTNPALEELSGWSREELLKETAKNLYEFKEDEYERKIRECIEKGFYSNLEGDLIRKDGKRVPITANSSLMKDSNGKPTGRICTVTDITELRKRESDLKKAKLLSDLIIDSSTIPIVITGRDGRWIRVNAAFENLFGYKAEEVLGKRDYELPIWTA